MAGEFGQGTNNVGGWPSAYGETPPNDIYPDGFDNVNGIMVPRDTPANREATSRWRDEREGAKAYMQDVNRYQGMGAQEYGRQAHQANYGDYEYGSQNAKGALGLMQQAAEGSAPSQAELLGRTMIDQSEAAAKSMAGGARGGPLAQAAAMQAAQNQGARQRQAGVQGLSAMRANEMAGARQGYMQGALGYGQMGLGRSQQELQNEQFQRQQNQQGRLAYEQMGFDVKAAEQSGRQAAAGMNQNAGQFNQEMADRRDERNRLKWESALSDARAKNVVSPGDAASREPEWLRGARDSYEKRGEGPWFENPNEGKKDPWLEEQLDKRHTDMKDDEFLSNYMSDSRLQRENPYGEGPGQPRDIVRENPYTQQNLPGNKKAAPMDPYKEQKQLELVQKLTANKGLVGGLLGGASALALSDERAKVEAYTLGRSHEANLQKTGKLPAPPDFLRGGKTEDDGPKPTTMGKASSSDAERAPKPGEKRGARHAEIETGPPQTARVLSVSLPPTSSRLAGSPEVQKENDRAVTNASLAVNQAAKAPPVLLRPGQAPPTSFERMRPDLYTMSDERTKEDAARKLESSLYTYKDEYLPPEQGKGELNFGPMAQKMEENELTATAVKKNEDGMRMIDIPKLVKVQSGIIADLRKDLDELKYGGAA